MSNVIDFIHDLKFSDIPKKSQMMGINCILDLIGVGISGTTTNLSKLICDHAVEMYNSKTHQTRILFDGRYCSPAGAALAGGMTIDSIDAHDGFNGAKGHVGCGILPSVVAFADITKSQGGNSFLTDIVLGYELGSRLALALHASASDYHTSGSWISIAVAALGARRLKLGYEQTRHALGIAEYHGPRSQMMRCIDHPTMLKDGSGVGAMIGVSAAFLAKKNFTGAPAITVENLDHLNIWQDLGKRWLIEEQYFKPYPVCRWAQGPIEAVLSIKEKYNISSDAVEHIEVITFHEAVRLSVREPKNTEQAQYSTSYPCAVALVKGDVGVQEISEKYLYDPEVLRISKTLKMVENEFCNSHFPEQRYARAKLNLKNGKVLISKFVNPRWTAEIPPSKSELSDKFYKFTESIISLEKAKKIKKATQNLIHDGSINDLLGHLYFPYGKDK